MMTKRLKNATILSVLIVLLGLSSCTKIGMYSIVLRSPIQHEKNEFNDLKDKEQLYHAKKVEFPESIAKMSDNTKKTKLEEHNKYPVHKVDTTIKMALPNIPAQVSIKSVCQQGIATVNHESSNLRKNGKLIDVKLTYTCIEEGNKANWATDGEYLIQPFGQQECSSGFHSVEFMFYNSTLFEDKLAPDLARFLFVCGKK